MTPLDAVRACGIDCTEADLPMVRGLIERRMGHTAEGQAALALLDPPAVAGTMPAPAMPIPSPSGSIVCVDRSGYDRIERLNISRLKRARISPLHYRADVRHETKPLALGTLAHLLTLEPERADGQVAVWDGKVRRGKEWDAFQAEHAGCIIATAAEVEAALTMAEAVRNHPVAASYLQHGMAEATLLWEMGSRKCKGRVDWLDQSTDTIVDLKTAAEIDPRSFGRAVLRYATDLQLAFYADGYTAITGRTPRVVVIAVESKPPHDVIVYRVPDSVIARGRAEYWRLLDLLTTCEASGQWPGQAADEVELELPVWATVADEEPALTMGGVEVSL